jgi:hypothetical protein
LTFATACVPTFSTLNESACGSFTLNAQTYTSGGTYNQVVQNVGGCDSTITLNLTINQPTTGIDIQTACGSFDWIDGNTYTSSNSTATHTIIGGALNGCDSIVSLNLTINQPTTGIDIQTACGSFDWIDGNTYTSSNSTATHIIIGGALNGCDSIVSLNLTINQPTTGIDIQTACGSFDWIDGNTYTSSNSTATHTIIGGALNGCDSIVTLNLTLTTINTSVNVSGATLTAAQAGAQYIWIDCETETPIAGENGQSYTATANGNYKVQVTLNGCVETSECESVTGLSISEQQSSMIAVYPNPVKDYLYITIPEGATQVLVTTLTGEQVLQLSSEDSNFKLDVKELSQGMYLMSIQLSNGIQTQRFIKE